MTFDRLRQIVRMRLRSLTSGRSLDRELDEELRYHVEQQIEDNIARGMSPEAARTAALRAIGGIEQRKEECRDHRGVTIVESALQDTRHAWRVLKRSPVFAAVAVSSLALGLGAFMAIFQLVDAIRLRPLPIDDAHELVEIKVAGGRNGWGLSETAFSEATNPLWEGLRAQQHSLSEIFAWGRTNVLVGRGPDAEPVRGLATLMLARGNARRREFAMLITLGAARRRLIAQIVAEALMLSAAGVALAVPIALFCSRAMILLLSTGNQLQLALVVGQLAVCFVLIVSSLLFVRSFRNLSTIDVGFNPIDLQVIRFADPYVDRLPMPRRLTFQQQLLEEMSSMPGVQSAASLTQAPMSGASWSQGFTLGADKSRGGAKFTYASPGLFETLQIPIRRGRDISPLDTPAAKPVAIVNDAFIKKFFGSGEAIGATLRTVGEAGYPPTVYEIVGVVGDIKYGDLREDPTPIVYIPLMQVPTLSSWKSVIVRTRLTRAAVTDEAKRRISRLNPEIRLFVSEMPVQLSQRLVRERMLAWLAGAFGVLAVTLAAVGLYGLIAYLSLSRRAEIDLRLALGARRREVVSLILSQTIWVVACGVGGGAALSLVALRGAGALLVGLAPSDPTTLSVASLTVAVIAGAAALIPAIRASRVDPMTTLRAEES